MDRLHTIYSMARANEARDSLHFYRNPAINTLLQNLYSPYDHVLPSIGQIPVDPFEPTNLQHWAIFQNSGVNTQYMKEIAEELSIWDARQLTKQVKLEQMLISTDMCFDYKYQTALQGVLWLLRHKQYRSISAQTAYSALFMQSFQRTPQRNDSLFPKQDRELLQSVAKRYLWKAPSLVHCLTTHEQLAFRRNAFVNCFCQHLQNPELDLSQVLWLLNNRDEDIDTIWAHWILLLQIATLVHPSITIDIVEHEGSAHFPFWHSWIQTTTRNPLWLLNFPH
jgi:hypothetical protein